MTQAQNNGGQTMTALQKIDQETGEVAPIESIPHSANIDRLMDSIRETALPIHVQALEALEADNETREAIENAYNGTEPQSFKRFAGQEHIILGMRIFEHGPYTGLDKELHDGFFQVQILLDERDTEGRYVVIGSGSASLLEHCFYILKNRGWYLFAEPIKYRFSLGEKNQHYIYNTNHDLKKRLTSKK